MPQPPEPRPSGSRLPDGRGSEGVWPAVGSCAAVIRGLGHSRRSGEPGRRPGTSGPAVGTAVQVVTAGAEAEPGESRIDLPRPPPGGRRPGMVPAREDEGVRFGAAGGSRRPRVVARKAGSGGEPAPGGGRDSPACRGGTGPRGGAPGGGNRERLSFPAGAWGAGGRPAELLASQHDDRRAPYSGRAAGLPYGWSDRQPGGRRGLRGAHPTRDRDLFRPSAVVSRWGGGGCRRRTRTDPSEPADRRAR